MNTDMKNPQDAEASELDATSLAAIRDLLAHEDDDVSVVSPVDPREARRIKPSLRDTRALKPIEPARALALYSAPSETTDEEREVLEETRVLKKRKKSKPKGEGILSRLMAKVAGYRPSKKIVLLACVALMVVVWPWVVFGALFFTALLLTGVVLILGYDGFWYQIMSIARWYARKHPSRSQELHGKLDRFAVRFDSFLDRFPEGSVDGLYLPDFGGGVEAEARHDETLDRRFEKLRDSKA